VCSVVNGIVVFPVEAEVNCGWGDAFIVVMVSISPILRLWTVLLRTF
jgi:hypothetical protein